MGVQLTKNTKHTNKNLFYSKKGSGSALRKTGQQVRNQRTSDLAVQPGI